MSGPTRFLLGRGELLSAPVILTSAPPELNFPYAFDEACSRVSGMVATTIETLSSLPALARPGDQVVSRVMVHPRGLAKSYHPGKILEKFNLRQVGSQPADVIPEKDNKGRTPSRMQASALFIAGTLSDFRRLGHAAERGLPGFREDDQSLLQWIESVSAPATSERIRGSRLNGDHYLYETVLHQAKDANAALIARGFADYANSLGAEIFAGKGFQVGGLRFVPVSVDPQHIDDLAEFAFLRVARPMPQLREVSLISRSMPMVGVAGCRLPDAIDTTGVPRVAVFDGGLADDSVLAPYVKSIDPPGIGEPQPELLSHGFDVTSSVLFGPLTPGKPIMAPGFGVDHYRVLDAESHNDPFELYDVLGRIRSVLEKDKPKYVNLSLGPALPTEDTDVHSWTAVLDDYVSRTGALITVAGGNTGDQQLPESRIQVPGDSVNMLCVGAADSRRAGWNAAEYSSRGPGRRPGVRKPDVLAFGGVATEPFIVVNSEDPTGVAATVGTSFAAPAVLNTAARLRAKFGPELGPLAAKALIVHSSEPGAQLDDSGWGRASDDLDYISVCTDGMVRVLYQGFLEPTKSLRARIPLPPVGQLQGMVTISATMCYVTETDPQDPSNYSRAGLDIRFRPHSGNYKSPDQRHPDTDSFFRNNDFQTESDLRESAYKWETVLHRVKKGKRASSLVDPCFDIHYVPRTGGGSAKQARRIPYAMVITVESKSTPDLYEKVVRTHQVLTEIQPVSQIGLQISQEG